MIIDHIGYLCKDINKSITSFETLGYKKISEIISDNLPFEGKNPRNVNLCFLKNEDTVIELVAPIEQEDSVVSKQLTRQGEGPYHICYQTTDIEMEVVNLKKNGFIIVQPLAPAVAFSGRRVAFLFRSSMGLIELVEV